MDRALPLNLVISVRKRDRTRGRIGFHPLTATIQIDEAFHTTRSPFGSNDEGVSILMSLQHSRCLDFPCAGYDSTRLIEPARCLTCPSPYTSRVEGTEVTLRARLSNEFGGPMPPGGVQIRFQALANVDEEARDENYSGMSVGTNSAAIAGRLVNLVVEVDPIVWPPR